MPCNRPLPLKGNDEIKKINNNIRKQHITKLTLSGVKEREYPHVVYDEKDPSTDALDKFERCVILFFISSDTPLTAQASLSLGDSYHIDENYLEAIDAYAAAISRTL